MVNVYKIFDDVYSLWDTAEPGMVAAMPHDTETGRALTDGFRYFARSVADRAKPVGQLKPAQEKGLEKLVYHTEMLVKRVYPGGEVVLGRSFDRDKDMEGVGSIASEIRAIKRWVGMDTGKKPGKKSGKKKTRKAKDQDDPPSWSGESEPDDLSDVPF